MFLNRRAVQAEYFDVLDRPVPEMDAGYAMLAHMNRLFLLADSFKRVIPHALGGDQCRALSILDLGAGDGSLADDLAFWAGRKGWDWRFTNLDLNPRAIRNAGSAHDNITASVLALPFRDQSFDVVIASQMAHHLAGADDVRRHFAEAWRVTRALLFMNDLHRNVVLYSALWALLKMHRYPAHFQSDGLLSVRRGWRVGEWRRLANQAGISNARVWLLAGARVMLQARRSS